MNMLGIALLIAAYLIGSLSGSLLLGKLRGVDIRTQGSGNAGSTNAFRTQGAKFAIGVLAIDLSKGVLATWLAQRFGPPQTAAWLPHAAAFAAIVGHVWPVWHGFRGGKGAATAIGGALMLWPAVIPPLIGLWCLCLILSGYVGLSTVIAGIGFAVVGLIGAADTPQSVFAVATAALIVFTHRANLARLRAGTESRFEKARLLHRLAQRR